ncbi:hypothetical protein BHM03_00056611 [Ensete ventricosum]|nr:hypothetical protein BHM03_00056611 [Ensete ventricosum]
MDVKALKAFGIMKLCHDFDSVVSVKCLIMIRDCYNISNEFVLHVPLLGHRSYDTFQNGFSVSIDALEMELRFPHHPMIKEWHEVGGTPSNNKGWKTRHMFISDCRGWGFHLERSAHVLSNVPSYLYDEESDLITRLKRILSAYRAIKDIIELWFVETA